MRLRREAPRSGAGGENPCPAGAFVFARPTSGRAFPADRSSGWPPAAAIVGGKELLVLTSHQRVGYDSLARLAAQIRRLAEEGRVIFIVTHDYEFICRTCSRALHLDGGKLRNDLPVTAENLSEIRAILGVR